MSSQRSVSVDLEEIRRLVRNVNIRCRDLGFKAEDSRTGLQLMEFWLPEPVKKLLIEEHNRPDDEKTHIALVKYFNPYGIGSWYFSEYDPEADEFFGLTELQFRELGYTSNRELREIWAPPFKLPLERDLWFEPKPLDEC